MDGAGSGLCLAELLRVDGLMVGRVARKEDTCLGDLQDPELGLTPILLVLSVPAVPVMADGFQTRRSRAELTGPAAIPEGTPCRHSSASCVGLKSWLCSCFDAGEGAQMIIEQDRRQGPHPLHLPARSSPG